MYTYPKTDFVTKLRITQVGRNKIVSVFNRCWDLHYDEEEKVWLVRREIALYRREVTRKAMNVAENSKRKILTENSSTQWQLFFIIKEKL